MSDLKKKFEYILKHNLFAQRSFSFVMSNFFRIIGLFIKIDNNLVLISSFGGRRYNDSPKAISEYLHSHDEYSFLKIVWAFEEPEKVDIPFVKVKIDTWNYFCIALKAKFWISCVSIERGLHFKKAETCYLNTWHGIPIKLIGNAVKGRNDFDFSNVDILCYSGSYEKDIYVRDLGILQRNMLLCGLPRNDELYYVTDEKIKQIKQKLNINNIKVILYAPTWRENYNDKGYSIKPPINISLFEKCFSDEYIILLRLHHFTTQLLGIQFNKFVIDVSQYPEINELMMVADILISDYSSIIFDYAILERPIISFAYDYNEYVSEHGFYINFEKELGIVKNQDELINKIKSIDYQDECKKTLLFKKKYIEAGGNATEQCVKALFGF